MSITACRRLRAAWWVVSDEPVKLGVLTFFWPVVGEVEEEILANDPEDVWLLGRIGLAKLSNW